MPRVHTVGGHFLWTFLTSNPQRDDENRPTMQWSIKIRSSNVSRKHSVRRSSVVVFVVSTVSYSFPQNLFLEETKQLIMLSQTLWLWQVPEWKTIYLCFNNIPVVHNIDNILLSNNNNILQSS